MNNSTSEVVSRRTKDLIDKLLLGKLSLSEIAKITGVSEQWLKSHVNPQHNCVS